MTGAESSWPTRLHCGRCGRVIERLLPPTPENRVVVGYSEIRGAAIGRGLPADDEPGRNDPKQPSARPQTRLGGPGDRKMTDTVYTVGCHPKRCGATYQVRRPRLGVAMERARAQGRDWVAIGDGPWADQRGGSDL